MNSKKYILVKDRVEIYKDFALNLLYFIQRYYVDRESLSDDVDIRNHFNWCFNKTCDEFLLEEIDFTKNNELREYFHAYYYHEFYKVDISKRDITLNYYENFWKSIFEFDRQKNKNSINLLVEIYLIFDKSINSEKNILELV